MNLEPLSILFFQRLRDVARAAGGARWRSCNGGGSAIVKGPEHPPATATERDSDEFRYYGGALVAESIFAKAEKEFMLFMDPETALAISKQMLVAEDSPLTIEQARVIATWRVNLECSYGRVGELAAIVWGKDSAQLSGERLCAEAERLLGRTFDNETH